MKCIMRLITNLPWKKQELVHFIYIFALVNYFLLSLTWKLIQSYSQIYYNEWLMHGMCCFLKDLICHHIFLYLNSSMFHLYITWAIITVWIPTLGFWLLICCFVLIKSFIVFVTKFILNLDKILFNCSCFDFVDSIMCLVLLRLLGE